MKHFPRYPKREHASGQARIVIGAKTYYLGKFNSPESHAEYRRLMGEFATGNFIPAPKSAGVVRATVGKITALWLASADASPKEIVQVKLAVVPLDRLFGGTLADEFDARRLKALRDAMVSGSWMTPKERATRNAMNKACEWSRSHVNHQIARIKRIFQWAEVEGHIAKGVWHNLAALGPIPRNAKVRIAPKRKFIDYEAQVKPCLPFLPPRLAVAVQVQYLAGMRPSEVLSMRRHEVDISSTPGVWLYTPAHHKTERTGELVKVIGPLGQSLLAPLLMAAEPEGFVFTPMRNRYRRGRYMVNGYYQAIERACLRAKVKRWAGYDLRHAAAKRAEETAGLTGASALLGHRMLETTQIYAGRQSVAVAVELAKKIG
jgi:integrase